MKPPISIPKLNLLKVNSCTTTTTNNEELPPKSPSHLNLRSLFSTSPRHHNNSPRNSSSSTTTTTTTSLSIINNLQLLPQHLLEDILRNILDFLLPSYNYTELCTISKHFLKVIESMKGFVLVIGINDSQSRLSLQWYQKHFKRVAKIKIVNSFFKNSPVATQFLSTLLSIPHDPSLDFSDNFLTKEVLNFLSQKLLENRYLTHLNLSRTTSEEESTIQEELAQLFKSLSLNTSIQYLEYSSSTISSKFTPPSTTIVPFQHQQQPQQQFTTDYSIYSSSYITPPTINFSLVYLDLADLDLTEDFAIEFSNFLPQNYSLHTLIYNNNPKGIHHLFKSISKNQSLTNVNFSECLAFNTMENITAFQSFIRYNQSIKYLDISKNSFNLIPDSCKLIISSLFDNSTLIYLNLSQTSPTGADTNLFPLLSKLYQHPNNNIHSLIISNNHPFPDPQLYSQHDFLSNTTALTNLDLSNLRLNDQKFIPIINSLNKYQKSYIIKLNLSINRLRTQSAIEIAKFLENNNQLADLNLGFNILKEGVTIICNALHHTTTLRILNLYSTQIRNNEAKSIAKLLSVNKSITELDIGYNIHINPVLNCLENNTNIKKLHICSLALKTSFIRLLQKNQTLTYVDVSNSNINWKSVTLINSLLKNKVITKFNFSPDNTRFQKLLQSSPTNSSKINVRVFPTKYYYF
eukprot:gene7466-9173_t